MKLSPFMKEHKENLKKMRKNKLIKEIIKRDIIIEKKKWEIWMLYMKLDISEKIKKDIKEKIKNIYEITKEYQECTWNIEDCFDDIIKEKEKQSKENSFQKIIFHHIWKTT